MPSTSTRGSLRPVASEVTGTVSLARGATPATFASPERRSRISPATFLSKYLSRASGTAGPPAPDSGCSNFTTTSTRPIFSSACMRRDYVRVSPVVNAAKNSSVARIRPTTIRAVCARRCGTFRTAILKEVRSRMASTPRIRAPAAKMPRRPQVNCCVGIPKSLSIVPPRTGWLVALDHAVAHANYPVGATGDGGVVGNEDEGLTLFSVELYQQLHDLPGGLRVQRPGRLVRPHDGRMVYQRAGDRHPLLLAAAHLVRALARLLGNANRLQYRRRSPARLLGLRAGNQERQLDVLYGRENGDQVVGLEDEAHLLRPKAGAFPV